MDTVDLVYKIAKPIADENDFRIIDVEYLKEGKHWFLRLYIDKAGGVDLNDCTRFSELLSEELDKQDPDPIPFAYYLEVSSPGAERPLKTEEDLIMAEGRYIHVSLFNAFERENVYEGTLIQVKDESIVLEVKEKQKVRQIEIARDNLSKARLAIEF